MALTGTGVAWGDSVYSAAVDITDLDAGEQAQVKVYWEAVCSVHAGHITGNAIATGFDAPSLDSHSLAIS